MTSHTTCIITGNEPVN